MTHRFSHRHRHAHMHKRQKVICPIGEDCRINGHNNPCHHAIEHLQNKECEAIVGCPECIKTQEVIEEETFTEEEFEL